MGMSVKLTDGRVTVTVEGAETASRMEAGQACAPATEPPVADLRSGPDMSLIAQLVKAIRRRAETIGEVSIAADCEQIQKELAK